MKKTIDIEQLYQQGILSFDQCLQIASMGAEVAQDAIAPKVEKAAPKKKAAKKSRAKKPQPEVKESTTGKVYYTPQKHELSAYQVKRLDSAVEKVRKAGFSKAEWRVEGQWAWIYPFAAEGTGHSPAFKAAVEKAFKGSKWAYSARRGAVVYRDFIK